MADEIEENYRFSLDNTISTLRRCLQALHCDTSVEPYNSSETRSFASQTGRALWDHQHFSVNEKVDRNKKADSIILVDYKQILGTPFSKWRIVIQTYKKDDETQIGDIMRLITKDLSEPYSIYTYRYFIHNWPELCVLAYDTKFQAYVGAVVCKLDRNAEGRRKGYLAMLAIDESYRKLGLGTSLVQRAIERMQAQGCDEVVLETEVSNVNAQRLYSNLGFIREKRLMR
ncbi:acetyltransferase, GNAT family [Dictyocaulus viviparus]|uniref:Acetyltransferase, GNAT family n=1 Tax=Dictyocaulus viviparus TaxID=29172 RepID=A0A0D8XUQ5_DICVI|nr:acetyltransferase, GNAT family [Dictyocaulus viviparus]